MNKFKLLAMAAAVSAGLLGSAGVMAAQDSELVTDGPASGWFDIFLFNNAQAKIWGLEDYIFDATSGDTLDKDVCVYTNTAEFRMTVESSNGDFTLLDAADAKGADYKVTIEDKEGTDPEVWGAGEYASGFSPLTDFIVGANTTDPNVDCGGSNATRNVNVKIDLTRALPLADPGAYSDRVTLTVAPI